MSEENRINMIRIMGGVVCLCIGYSVGGGNTADLHSDRKINTAFVSVVTPTFDKRHKFHERLHHMFEWQDYPNKELVVCRERIFPYTPVRHTIVHALCRYLIPGLNPLCILLHCLRSRPLQLTFGIIFNLPYQLPYSSRLC